MPKVSNLFVVLILSLTSLGAVVAQTTNYSVEVEPYVIVVDNDLRDVSRTISIDSDSTKRTLVVNNQNFKIKSNSGFVVELRMPMDLVRGYCVPVFRNDSSNTYVKAELIVRAGKSLYDSRGPSFNHLTRGVVIDCDSSGVGSLLITRPEPSLSPLEFTIWLAFPAGEHLAGTYDFTIQVFPQVIE